eukprot:Lithocolla_globosa_v1_NODE_3291_length_1710_cov_4.891239.p3 type:complete len:156 gc:universal NODE_3291_length_1710_cov_4.891239:1709-1242(-)
MGNQKCNQKRKFVSMEDLEDLEDIAPEVQPRDLHSHERNFTVNPKSYVRKRKNVEPKPVSGIVPGIESVYVRTWGCSHNNSDGEYMAGQLAAYGYSVTDTPDEANLWVLNSCTVKNPSEQSFLNAIEKATEAKKKLVLAGCVPQGEKNSQETGTV